MFQGYFDFFMPVQFPVNTKDPFLFFSVLIATYFDVAVALLTGALAKKTRSSGNTSNNLKTSLTSNLSLT